MSDLCDSFNYFGLVIRQVQSFSFQYGIDGTVASDLGSGSTLPMDHLPGPAMIGAIAMVHGKNGFFMSAGGFEYNLALICLSAHILMMMMFAAAEKRVKKPTIIPIPPRHPPTATR
ncbi:MAG: hypothetical protein U0796_12740 [Gemmatales bacterium]